MSKQFVNDVVSIAILATCWHEVPMPPLEGEVPNEREAEGFVRQLSNKPLRQPIRAASSPFRGAKAASPLGCIRLSRGLHIFNSCNRPECVQ